MTMEEVNVEPEVKDAITAIDVAIALGADIAARPGSFFYELRYFDNSDDSQDFCIGRFQTVKACDTALVGWIVNEWGNSDRTPWKDPGDNQQLQVIADSEHPEQSYLEAFTETQVIDAYFKSTYDRYSIEKHYIKG